jgi:preprotein translocase subunit SecF
VLEQIVRLRYLWFAISFLTIIPGMVFLALFGLRPGIDFSGGALWDIQFLERQQEQLNTEVIARIFAEQDFEGSIVQLSDITIADKTIPVALVRTKPLSASNPEQQQQQILATLQAEYGQVRREQIQSVGATVSQESTRSAVIAVIAACVVILVYLSLAFRKAPHPIRYGTCAILAMLHDFLLVIGVAAILGYYINLEIDALFLTALLTMISFSVHDTIVVFDRIRENLLARRSGETFEDIVNHSIVQTLPRSIITSLTSLFTLTALLLYGGESIRNFVLILLIGLVSGTYSSIFNAAQLLVVWENREWRRWFGRGTLAVETSTS